MWLTNFGSCCPASESCAVQTSNYGYCLPPSQISQLVAVARVKNIEKNTRYCRMIKVSWGPLESQMKVQNSWNMHVVKKKLKVGRRFFLKNETPLTLNVWEWKFKSRFGEVPFLCRIEIWHGIGEVVGVEWRQSAETLAQHIFTIGGAFRHKMPPNFLYILLV